uniref:(California timema) hypothetical protein n=1 Tax=Timema californicum TaxID=61474 RepID=A0A7R9PB14_TIMCA|nr:unnamed protein product [Timema californicum]
MGKAKKLKVSKNVSKLSLDQQIEDDKFAKPSTRVKVRQRQVEQEEFVDSTLSQRILHQAREQQRELEDDAGLSGTEKPAPSTSLGAEASDESDEEEDNMAGDFYYDKIEVNEDDERALEMFMSRNPAPRRTLADIIKEKITEKHTELQTQFSDAGSVQVQELDPRVKQLYEGVRDVLAKYRTGKLPKAFKIYPPRWSAAAMYQATRIFTSNLSEKMAQRFFNLVLLPRVRDDIAEYKRLNFHLFQALRKALFKPGAFMKGLLLPLCESGNCTLREAIILGSVVARNSIPLLHSSAALLKIAEMDYTGANSIFLRIFFDKKYALPYRVVDAAVFHFLRTPKKALQSKEKGRRPGTGRMDQAQKDMEAKGEDWRRVAEGEVWRDRQERKRMCRTKAEMLDDDDDDDKYKWFERDRRELPVLWHQALLTFVQRYKGDISSEQKEALLGLLRRQSHGLITPEIRRELQAARCRDLEGAEPMVV